jgi:hypothetical protein
VDDLPEQVRELEEEGQDNDEEGGVRLFVLLLLLHAGVDGQEEEGGEDEEENEVQAKTSLVFETEVVYLLSFTQLGDDVEINFNLWHHLMAHVSVMLAVHYHKEVDSRHVLVVKNSRSVLTPI